MQSITVLVGIHLSFILACGLSLAQPINYKHFALLKQIQHLQTYRCVHDILKLSLDVQIVSQRPRQGGLSHNRLPIRYSIYPHYDPTYPPRK